MSQPTPLDGQQVGALPKKNIVGVPWHIFLAWFADVWQVGQHVTLIAPTDSGKTTFAVPVLRLRKWVMAIDAKGGDSRLAAAGFTSLSKWPPPSEIMERLADELPVRLNITYPVRNRLDRMHLKKLARDAIEGAFDFGGWTMYLDEFQVTADQRMMGLGVHAEELLVSARDPKRMTIVTAYQAPAWVPRASTRQAQWIAVWKTLDEDVIKALAQKMGRDKRMLLAAMKAMGRHYVLVAGTDVDAPLVCTKAPPLD